MSDPSDGVVEIPCAVVQRDAASATIVVGRNRRVTLPASAILYQSGDSIMVAAATAGEHRLPTIDQCLTVGDVARRFRFNVDWVYRNIGELMADEGFPRPVTERGQMRWDASSVEAWFTRHHPDRAAAVPDEPPADEGAAHRARLAAAYGQGAQT